MCLKNNRVLIVDDDLTTVEMLHSLVTDLGFQAFGYSSVTDAMANFDKVNPTLVISDLYMPDDTGEIKKMGFKFAKWVKSKDECCPVMILSSEKDPVKQIYYVFCGISLFCTKPFRKEELQAKIMQLSGVGRLSKLSSAQLKKEYGGINDAQKTESELHHAGQRR